MRGTNAFKALGLAAGLSLLAAGVSAESSAQHGNGDQTGQSQQGQGMMRGQGMHHGGQHHGAEMMHGPALTLGLTVAGKGREMQFRCDAEMSDCLSALERVRDIMEMRGPRHGNDK